MPNTKRTKKPKVNKTLNEIDRHLQQIEKRLAALERSYKQLSKAFSALSEVDEEEEELLAQWLKAPENDRMFG